VAQVVKPLLSVQVMILGLSPTSGYLLAGSLLLPLLLVLPLVVLLALSLSVK